MTTDPGSTRPFAEVSMIAEWINRACCERLVAWDVDKDARARGLPFYGWTHTPHRVTSIDALADLDLAGASAQRIRRKGVVLGRSASAEAIRDVVLGRDPIGGSARRPQTDVGMQERPASTPSVQVMVGPERRSNG